MNTLYLLGGSPRTAKTTIMSALVAEKLGFPFFDISVMPFTECIATVHNYFLAT